MSTKPSRPRPRTIKRFLFYLASPLALLLLLVATSARATPPSSPTISWHIASPTIHVVARIGALIITRDGHEIAAYGLNDGKKRWSTRIAHLRASPHAVAADTHGVYALSQKTLYVIAIEDGAITHTEALKHPRGLLLAGGSVYIALERGVLRYAPGASKRLTSSKRFSGALRGAHGDVVVLFRELKGKTSKIKGSPKRLTVIDLKRDRLLYEFRLIPTGAHRLLRIDENRVSFLDYSQLHEGTNSKRLFFTEADYRKKKKLRDLSLKAHYVSAKADLFYVHALGHEALLLVQTGAHATTSTLLVFDLATQHVRWKISTPGEMSAPLVRDKEVWIATKRPQPRLLAYALDKGKKLRTISLAKPAQGALHDGGPQTLLVRQRAGLHAIDISLAVASSASKPTAPPATAAWRLYRDRVAGYTIKLPTTWRFNPQRVRHFGPSTFAVPFYRYETQGKRWNLAASLHLLVRPARNQRVDALWKAVLKQRRRRAGKVTVTHVERGSRQGHPQIVGSYRFANRFGEQETAKSLCLVAHDLAYELRVRVRPSVGTRLDKELSKILDTFTLLPHPQKTSP